MLLRAVVARVLDDALAHAQRQVQPAMRRVPLLEVLHDAQRMKVVIEAQPMPLQAFVQRSLARVPKRRMPDVVHQRQRLRQVLVQPQRLGHAARNLHHLNRVRQAAAKVVRGAAGEHLRLACQPAERPRLHNALAVALKRRARCPLRRAHTRARHQRIVAVIDRAAASSPPHGAASAVCAIRADAARLYFICALNGHTSV